MLGCKSDIPAAQPCTTIEPRVRGCTWVTQGGSHHLS